LLLASNEYAGALMAAVDLVEQTIFEAGMVEMPDMPDLPELSEN
jgi:hypothetical protein